MSRHQFLGRHVPLVEDHPINCQLLERPRQEEKRYRSILRDTNLEASDISYVELHGTATQAGDVTEITSVANAIGKGRSASTGPLYVAR